MHQQKNHSHYRHPVYLSGRQLSVYPLRIGRQGARRKRKAKHEKAIEHHVTLPTIQILPRILSDQYLQNRIRQHHRWKKETQIKRYRHPSQYFQTVPQRFQPLSTKQKVGRDEYDPKKYKELRNISIIIVLYILSLRRLTDSNIFCKLSATILSMRCSLFEKSHRDDSMVEYCLIQI